MPFINPFSYGGAVKFNVHAVHELPADAKADDIYLVFAEGATLPDVSNIKALAVVNNFDQTLGNIYPDNTVVLFCRNAGTLGTNLLHYKTKNLAFDIPIVSTVAVVNHNGQQIKCSVQTYNAETEEWQTSSYIQLPILLTEALDFSEFYNVQTTVPDLFANLGLADSYSTESETLQQNETLDFLTFFGTQTVPDLFVLLGLVEGAKYNTGGEDITIQ